MDDVGTVHLIDPDQAGGINTDRPRRAGAVLEYVVTLILARQAAIESGERAGGHAAAAREEAVRLPQVRGDLEIRNHSHAKPYGASERSVYRSATQCESHGGEGVC
jgi:hypothetical protein